MVSELLLKVRAVSLEVLDRLRNIEFNFKLWIFTVEAIVFSVVIIASFACALEAVIFQQICSTFFSRSDIKVASFRSRRKIIISSFHLKSYKFSPVSVEQLLAGSDWSCRDVDKFIVKTDCVHIWIT